MDTSKEYQDMVKAAPKIAENWKWKAGDFFIHEKSIEIVAFIQEEHPDIINSNVSMRYIQSPYNLKYDELIPLPRQDQLQDIMNIKKFGFIIIHKWVDFSIKLLNHTFPDSMEQLWLAFVMYEKYGKKWNGKEWVKI